jgi:hypothetical protein
LKNLDFNLNISVVPEKRWDMVETATKELTQHKPYGMTAKVKVLSDGGMRAKLCCLQNPCQMNRNNLNSIRCESSVHIKYRKGNIWKRKLIHLIEENSLLGCGAV